MSDNIDYRQLLKKYMLSVIEAEGIDYINGLENESSWARKEIDILRKISDEINEEELIK